MDPSSVYVVGLLGVFILCALYILYYSFRRAYRAYVNYVKDGVIDVFDVLASNSLRENNPIAILVDAVLLLISSIIFSAIWPISLIFVLGSIIAWCHRRVHLKLTEDVRIMKKLKGECST